MEAPERQRQTHTRKHYALAIQNSQESLRKLASRYGVNIKTVDKWKKRKFLSDAPMGSGTPKSTVLTAEEEAVIVTFRKHTLLPLDDCLYALQETIPHLTRSSLHRCLQRHKISRLPETEGEKRPKRKFGSYPIGFFHVDITEVRTDESKLHLFVAIDRTSKFVVAKLFDRATTESAKTFLETVISTVPYRIHTILTDNGIQFADLPKYRDGVTAIFRGHPFDRVCKIRNIEHRLTKPNHPWTNGQVERMSRTIKDATVNRYFYQNNEQLSKHLDTFAKRLKTLQGLTPYQFIVKSWAISPHLFHSDPYHLILGLDILFDILKQIAEVS